MKISILLILFLSSSSVFAQTVGRKGVGCVDTLTVNVVQDSLIVPLTVQDTLVVKMDIDSMLIENTAVNMTFKRSIMLYRDSARYNLREPYNEENFKFKYDPFKEKMKEPWIGDILKEILFR